MCKITCTRHDAINRSHELSTPSFASFSPCLKKQRRTKQDNEGQSNHHGAVDVMKSEQQIRESAVITLTVEISGSVHLALPGLTAGWQAGRRNTEIFKVDYRLKYSTCCFI